MALALAFISFSHLASASSLNTRNDGPQGDFDPKIEQLFDRYNVPYGVLGAISHVIMMYVLGCHLFGRRPLMPWRYLSQHLIDVLVTSCMAIVTVTIASLTISEVQESRALVMLLAMHIIFGLVMDGVMIHRYFYRERKGLMVRLAGWLCVLCVAGLLSSQMLAQITGHKRLDDTKWQWSDPGIIIIAVMGIGGGVIAVLSFLAIWRSSAGVDREKRKPIAVYVFFFSGMICALGWFWLADYGPVIATGNTTGQPRQGNKALFWAYFVFQWFPVFTI
ncbi:hypothetical protein QBC40DRAFT_169933 [Triangularia verruculosa]|uniref:Uncharacterized protein n=1 Tax=Triangularia verruculosa TaxID=2587418 RepID=A0AAN6XJY7_9PEZI|nr:hypothetical protein QBC40DRAFT_169933 [Triangularia verruculosa]